MSSTWVQSVLRLFFYKNMAWNVTFSCSLLEIHCISSACTGIQSRFCISSFAMSHISFIICQMQEHCSQKALQTILLFVIQWNIDCCMNITGIWILIYCGILPSWMNVTALAYYSNFLYSYCSDLMVKRLSYNYCGIGWSVATEHAVWFPFRPCTAVVCWDPALSCCVLSQVKSSLF